MTPAIRTAVERRLGGRASFETIGGGDINEAALVRFEGASYFLKWNRHGLRGHFEAEAVSLEALASVSSGLIVPEVLTYGDEGRDGAFLLEEYLEQASRGPGDEEALGRGLAALHRQGDPRGFGFPLDGYCGATPQANGWMSNWAEFYAQRRLAPQLRMARERGLSSRISKKLDTLIEKLPTWIDNEENPSLIHGDLWSGNVLTTLSGQPALIDPAAYYGHREAEFGMMTLFGGFSRRVYDAYDEAFPRADGHHDRLPLYQLYHVLNHFNLFGGSYAAQAEGLIARFV